MARALRMDSYNARCSSMMPGLSATMAATASSFACSLAIWPFASRCYSRSWRLYRCTSCSIRNEEIDYTACSCCCSLAMRASKCACAMVKPTIGVGTGSSSNASSILRSLSFELSSGELGGRPDPMCFARGACQLLTMYAIDHMN